MLASWQEEKDPGRGWEAEGQAMQDQARNLACKFWSHAREGSHQRFAAELGLVPFVLAGLLKLLRGGQLRAIGLVQYEFHEGYCNRDGEVRKSGQADRVVYMKRSGGEEIRTPE